MPNHDERKKLFAMILAVFFAAALSILFFFLLFRADSIGSAFSRLLGILMPFLYGFVIAYLLSPVCNFFERHFLRGTSRLLSEKRAKSVANGLAVASSFLAAAIVLYLLLSIVIPSVYQNLRVLVIQLPDQVQALIVWTEEVLAGDEMLQNLIQNTSLNLTDSLRSWLQEEVLPQLRNITIGFASGLNRIFILLKNLFLGAIVAVYLLAERKKFRAQLKVLLYAIFRRRWAVRIERELRFADSAFSGFISGKILDSAIIGVICFVACSILQIPGAVLVSIIVGVTNVIPFFGPYLGAIPSALLILVSDPVKCVWFIVMILILQQFDGNVLGPKILGNSTGLSGIWVLFSILLFGGLFGFVGMIVGVPLFAVLYDIFHQMIYAGIAHHQAEDVVESYHQRFPPQWRQPKEKKRRGFYTKQKGPKTGA